MLIVSYATIVGPEAERRVAAFATECDRRIAGQYIMLRRRTQSLAARALLRSVLEQATGYPGDSWHLIKAANGRPTVTANDGSAHVEVSLSHSREIIACAVSDKGPIGIDIEYCAANRNFAALAAAAFGECEARAVEQRDARTFYKIWTLREALAKALGAGLPLPAESSDLFFDAPAEGIWQTHTAGRDWRFSHRFLPAGYSLAVASIAQNDAMAAGG